MTHPSPDLLSRYAAGLLSPDEFLEVDDHLVACVECRRPASSRVADSVRTSIAGEHIEYEAMERYVDGTAPDDEAAVIDDHIALCAMCAEEIADLRGAVPVSQRQPQWLWWAAAAAVVLAILTIVLRWREPAEPHAVPPVRTVPPSVQTKTDPAASLTPALRDMLRQLSGGVLPSKSLVEDLRAGPEQTRGWTYEMPTFAVAEPRGVVAEAQPLFRWSTRSGGRYVVEIFDPSYRRVAKSADVKGDRWRPPTPLRRGTTYSWQVTEKRGDTVTILPAPPEPPARFHVIDAKAAVELEAAPSHLTAALIAAREGIVDRAESEMALALREAPESKEIRDALATLRRYQPAPTTTNPPQ